MLKKNEGIPLFLEEELREPGEAELVDYPQLYGLARMDRESTDVWVNFITPLDEDDNFSPARDFPRTVHTMQRYVRKIDPVHFPEAPPQSANNHLQAVVQQLIRGEKTSPFLPKDVLQSAKALRDHYFETLDKTQDKNAARAALKEILYILAQDKYTCPYEGDDIPPTGTAVPNEKDIDNKGYLNVTEEELEEYTLGIYVQEGKTYFSKPQPNMVSIDAVGQAPRDKYEVLHVTDHEGSTSYFSYTKLPWRQKPTSPDRGRRIKKATAILHNLTTKKKKITLQQLNNILDRKEIMPMEIRKQKGYLLLDKHNDKILRALLLGPYQPGVDIEQVAKTLAKKYDAKLSRWMETTPWPVNYISERRHMIQEWRKQCAIVNTIIQKEKIETQHVQPNKEETEPTVMLSYESLEKQISKSVEEQKED